MKYFSGFDNIFVTETWYLWGNIKILLRHLDCWLGTKGPHSDPADKNFLGLHIVSNVSKWSNLLFNIGLKLLLLASVLKGDDWSQNNNFLFLKKNKFFFTKRLHDLNMKVIAHAHTWLCPRGLGNTERLINISQNWFIYPSLHEASLTSMVFSYLCCCYSS